MDCSNKGAIKKRRVREFQASWLDDSSFKGWLAPHLSENRALCMICNKSINCRKSDLINHSHTVKHIENSGKCKAISNDNTLSHRDKVKRAEIKLAAFFADHNIAFSIVDHLVPLLKDISIDSKIVQDLSLSRKKCSKIVKNIIAKRETEKLILNLKTRKFSVLIDESTDISETKIMCVLVRYLSPINKKISTQLLDLISLDAKDCSSSKIFEAFKNLFQTKQIPLTNIIGLACDNASVMIGCNNSFMTHLKSEIPELITLNCICHSSALVASRACEKLPDICENLIKGVASYISGSAKRCAILAEFQNFFHVDRHKVLKLANTRWLSFQKCVCRLLENWDVLKSYFLLAVVEDKLKSAETILHYFQDNLIKAYLLFLKYSLNFFNTFNALFQFRNILIHLLYKNSRQLILQFGQNFVKLNVLNDIFNLNLKDKNNIQPVNEIYVGPECESFLENFTVECVHEIKLKCLDFYVTAVQKMLNRLPCKDPFFEQLSFLDPKIALFNDGRIKIKDLTLIAKRLNYNNITRLAYEWRILPTIFDDEKKVELASLEIDEMWKNVLESKHFDNSKIFPNLENLIEIVFSLPHSNAEAERIFSIVTDVKCKKRNRLTNNTLSAICIVRSSFQDQNINCYNFEVDDKHLELHNTASLYLDQTSSDED
ncbi:SCAN domain-containing protein 3-like [Cardiocondyla obscurior]|uniref:SCAN domain-containing protein 3-like n=1 Tax=Cardiocondyla obscurior TaxID=286306 RepID=UPI00396561B6